MQAMHSDAMHLNLKAFRRSRGLTQDDMAEAMGVEQSNISRFESGKVQPSLVTLYTAADHFGCSVADFFNPVTEASAPPQGKASGVPETVLSVNAAPASPDGMEPQVLVSVQVEGQGEALLLLSEALSLVLRERIDDAVRDLTAERKRQASALA